MQNDTNEVCEGSVERINFRIKGKSFNKETGYDLRTVAKSLDEFGKIIEKAYLVTINEPTLTKENRTNLQIKLRTVEDGSFLGGIDVGVIGTALQLFQQVDVKNVIDITKGAFEFLKLRNNSSKKGVPMTINNSENGIVVVTSGSGNEINITIPEKSLDLAEKAQSNFSSLAKLPTNDGEVESVTIEDNKSNPVIKFDDETRENFKVSSSYEDDTVEIVGRIISANEKTCTGRINIGKGNDMNPGEYPFELIDRDISIFHQKAFTDGVKFRALRKIKYDPSTNKKEVELLKLIS
ncbi:hypothetical protein [Lactococcus lactis]|uniref:hypothetical protein n=1 Tax=Lactococcus lactis TaxID=1358 RepID=UPI00034DBFAE|nr:hypothetical protein [Lactococcus lactis]KSU06107.1 hypothetical protein Li1_1267 [Lactococcus lactis subsp. lactis]